MTAPLQDAIQDAFNAHLRTPDLTTPATPIGWPLVTFSPTPDAAYLKVHAIMWAEPERPWLDRSAPVTLRGIFQVDAVMPGNKGTKPGITLAGLVADRFRDAPLIAGGRRLTLFEPYIAAAVTDAPWVRFPVSIRFRT